MKQVTPEAFIDLLQSRGSAALQAQLARFDLDMALGGHDESCYVIDGGLSLEGDWQPPAANLIVMGPLASSGFVHAQCADEDFDEGGSLWVLGDLDCRHFANDYGKSVFVDGNMKVSEIAVNAFQDASLVVTGDFKARYFYGIDIWVEAGGRIEMEYGEGYGLPIGYTEAAAQAVDPEHDKDTSLALLGVPDGRAQDALVERIRRQERFFQTP